MDYKNRLNLLEDQSSKLENAEYQKKPTIPEEINYYKDYTFWMILLGAVLFAIGLVF